MNYECVVNKKNEQQQETASGFVMLTARMKWDTTAQGRGSGRNANAFLDALG